MKKLLRYTLLAMMATVLSLSSCKKETETDDSADQKQMAADELEQSNESEAALADANDAISSTALGKTGIIAGGDIDTTSIAGKKILITYSGENKDHTRTRSGKVTIELTNGSKWKDAGAVLTITFTDFKVTRRIDGKSLGFNGSVTITNVNGGKVWENSPVVHKVAGAMDITFDDGTKRQWNIDRKRTFTNEGGIQTMSTAGEGNQNGFNNLVTWGTNRKNEQFYTQIGQPVVFSSSCPGKPVSGIKIHKGIKREISVTFGTDATGNTVTSGCPYGAMIKWTNAAKKEKTLVIQY